MPDIWCNVDAAMASVPVNIMPLLDDTDFKTRETSVAYNAAGMDLVWNFTTTAGTTTQTAVTPTSGGNYDWTNLGDGMYAIEIPASGGASINNDTEGFGWFTGVATGVLPWRGPVIGFRASATNDTLIDATMNDLSAAEVNAEVVDALNVDTYAEPGQGNPPATATLVQKVGYLYKAWRNKKDQSSSLYQLYADDTSTVDQKASVSDSGGTTTVGEVVTGP